MRGIAATAAVALTASCSTGGATRATNHASTTATTSTAATATVVGNDKVLQDYRAFWDAYLAAADPMDPLNPVLVAHASGGELETLQRAFLARKSGGEVIRGRLDLAPRLVSVVGATATVRDCYLDNTGVYDAKSGTRKDKATGVRHLVTASLMLDGATWKVSVLNRGADGCTAA